MIIKLCFILEIVFIAQSTSFKLGSQFRDLAEEINQAAFRSGLGPIAEVGAREASLEEVEGGNDNFDINNAKNIQDIKSMKELKDIQEITAMKEIKSIQEIPDEIAEQFISDNNLQPIESLDDEPEPEDYLESSSEEEVIMDPPFGESPEVDSSEGGAGCGESKQLRETLDQLKSLAGDMLEIISNAGLSEGNQLMDKDATLESEEIDSSFEDEDEDEEFPPEGESIVNVEEVSNIEEVKSISPIKSIQEVVGIYPLTEELAQKLKEINAGGRRRHRHRH